MAVAIAPLSMNWAFYNQLPCAFNHRGMQRNHTQSAQPVDSSVNETVSNSEAHTASSPIVHEELRCRYSNKKCMNTRTEKRTGGLHTFCEEHREAANRNQRRLDQKKSVEKRQQESIQTYFETLQAAAEHANTQLSLHPSPYSSLPLGARMRTVAPVVVEPYTRPAALLDEDVDVLVSLFGPTDLGDTKTEDDDDWS